VVPALLLGSLVGATACVVPPPIEIESVDGGVNAPPIIRRANDSALNDLRPPATLTVDLAVSPAAEIDLELYDVDAADELTIQFFVDYHLRPLAARLTCTAPPAADGSPTRRISCSTNGLCLAEDVGSPVPHRLELEVYDRRPENVAPYRTPPGDGLFSTWTLDLTCIRSP
jgi:hypothetical protein